MKSTFSYGSWPSPITADLIATAGVGLGGVVVDGDEVYWMEARPTENGRVVIVRRSADGHTEDVNPAPYNVRTRVHEYGGGAYTVQEGVVYFVHFADQRLYRVFPGGEPEAVTPEGPLRYADFSVSQDGSWLICVLEDHGESDQQAVNSLARVDLRTGGVQVLVSGRDFYSSPRISHDGRRLAWLSWDHPNMPWDDVELWQADLTADGYVENPRKAAGEPGESIMQPRWSPDGALVFISDRSNWWNLYRLEGDSVRIITAMDAEFGDPNWVFGMSTYDFIGPDRILAGANRDGRWSLLEIDAGSGEWSQVETPFDSLANVKVAQRKAYFTAGSTGAPHRIVELDLPSSDIRTLKTSTDLAIDPGYISTPEAIEFPTENGKTAYAFFYPPANKDVEAPAGERPPLLVFSHGGPTGQTDASFNLSIQYWTSRGFGVVDVNYGGSTGYGREYRRRLYGNWGIVDVDDCVNAARWLAAEGRVDPEKMAIRGGSAGGYTTLAALTFRKVFKAGASYFGVSDLGALAQDTHKFESRYLDQMVGPYPEQKDLYDARSPLVHAEQLETPVIFLQGLDDKVVPPNQAEMLVDVLREKGVPVAYVPFEGEQHGFRQAQNIRRALEAEYSFYAQIFGFETGEEVEPVEIENL